MKNLLILAHPDRESFQAALFRETAEFLKARGEQVRQTDLYGDRFPPLLEQEEIRRGISTDRLVGEQQKALAQCDRLLLFYPDWWGLPPAILKGWLDRVLASETAFAWEGEDFLEKTWRPLLTGKKAEIFVTGDGTLDREWLSQLWKDRILGQCGMTVTLRILDRMRHRSFAERQGWMDEQKKALLR
ncbi:MAG: NAD(P)H-dependent oxidoreductase [Spirochaetales bacterium]|nr:NAD(P)H-dependent oxidoreductase [Spirochaetales bacterium]